MQKRNVISSDQYIIRLAGVITDYDHTVLVRLYQPIIGQTALSLYLTMLSEVKYYFTSDVNSHQKLFELTQTDINTFTSDCRHLEALGLIKTYISTTTKEGEELYYYDLYSPLDAASFLSHPLYGLLLKQRISEETYNSLVTYFQMNNELEGHKRDISASFKSVYKVNLDDPSAKEILEKQGIDVKRNPLRESSSFDLNLLKSMFKAHNIKQEVLNEEVVKELDNAANLYGYNEQQLVTLMESSLISNGARQALDFDKFRNNCFINGKVLDDTVNAIANNANKISKKASLWDDVTPLEYLTYRQNNHEPMQIDVQLINEIKEETQLPDPVINVLIDYVLFKKNNSLPNAYTLKIAGDLMRNNIDTSAKACAHLKKKGKEIDDATIQFEAIKADSIKEDINQEEVDEEIARLRAERKAKKARK